MQIMTIKITTLQTLYVHVLSNSVMFPQMILFYVLDTFYVSSFFPRITFIINYVSSYRKM